MPRLFNQERLDRAGDEAPAADLELPAADRTLPSLELANAYLLYWDDSDAGVHSLAPENAPSSAYQQYWECSERY